MSPLSNNQRLEAISLILEEKLTREEIAKKLGVSLRAVDATRVWITIHDCKYNEYSKDRPEISRRIRNRSGGQYE